MHNNKENVMSTNIEGKVVVITGASSVSAISWEQP